MSSKPSPRHPSAAVIEVFEPEHVAKERPIGVRVAAEDDEVRTVDHPLRLQRWMAEDKGTQCPCVACFLWRSPAHHPVSKAVGEILSSTFSSSAATQTESKANSGGPRLPK